MVILTAEKNNTYCEEIMDLTKYKKNREIICAKIETVKSIAQNLDMEKHVILLDNYRQRLIDDHFNLVVVGMFSRGKSTFVDALLGRRILPTSKKPTTAVISKIIYGEEPRYVLHYKDKSVDSKILSEEEFRSLTAPKSADINDEDQVREVLRQQDELDKIAEAEVAYPVPLCKNGVNLVDTPGMNDVNRTRIEITYKYLKQADAVIMLLAADQILSISEVEFLKERILSRKIKDVFYIINRKDTLSGPEEEAKVIEFAKKNLKEIIPAELANDIHIFLVSSYQALLFRRQLGGEELSLKQVAKIPTDFAVTGFTEFEEALGNFLVNEKGKSKIESYKLQTIKVIDDMTAEIEDSLRLIDHSLDDIIDKVRRLAPEFKQARLQSGQIIKDMQLNLERYGTYITEQCQTAGNDILATACCTVDAYQGKLESNRLKQEINEAVAQQQKKFIDNIIKYQETTLQGELTKAQVRLQKIWQDVDAQYRTSLNLPMISNRQTIDISAIPHSNISEFRGTLGSYAIGGAIGGLLAGAVFPALAIGAIAAWCFGFFDNHEEEAKRKIKRQLVEQIPELARQMEKNVLEIYKIQSEELVSIFNKTIEGRISQMEDTMNQVLEEKRSKEHEQEERKRTLKDYHMLLFEIKNKLLL